MAELQEIGAGLMIWPNGPRSLRALGVEIDALAIHLMSVCTWRGRQVNDYPFESVAARFGFQPVFVHRADLLAALARRFGTEGLLFDAVVSGFKQDGAEVQVTMRDGTTVMSTRLVGSKDCGKLRWAAPSRRSLNFLGARAFEVC